jgi:hypothetical protein
MPLEPTSVEDMDKAQGRARVMLRMLKEERDRNVIMLIRERDAMVSHATHDTEIVTRQARFLGSYGAQLDTSKFNALTGAISALDIAIELCQEVVNKRT